MARVYNLPHFNSSCVIRKSATASPPIIDITTVCQIKSMFGLWQATFAYHTASVTDAPYCFMYFPAKTDVRDKTDNVDLSADTVECPAGSTSVYQVVAVMDEAVGFSNEFRLALVRHVTSQNGPRP